MLQALCAFPFCGWTDMAVAADLIDAPVNLQPVIVRVAEFDGKLTSGAPAPGEIDRDPMPAQTTGSSIHAAIAVTTPDIGST